MSSASRKEVGTSENPFLILSSSEDSDISSKSSSPSETSTKSPSESPMSKTLLDSSTKSPSESPMSKTLLDSSTKSPSESYPMSETLLDSYTKSPSESYPMSETLLDSSTKSPSESSRSPMPETQLESSTKSPSTKNISSPTVPTSESMSSLTNSSDEDEDDLLSTVTESNIEVSKDDIDINSDMNTPIDDNNTTRSAISKSSRFNKTRESIQDKFNDFMFYPKTDDPIKFNQLIANKEEFANFKYNVKPHTDEQKENPDLYRKQKCEDKFELAPHQMFIRNFLSYYSPYNGLLLYHGLGTGKTCSAITIAEEMRRYMMKIGIHKQIYILASKNVQSAFKREFFNESLLRFNQTNQEWVCDSCNGTNLLEEMKMNFQPSEHHRNKILHNVRKILKDNYQIRGYSGFVNLLVERCLPSRFKPRSSATSASKSGITPLLILKYLLSLNFDEHGEIIEPVAKPATSTRTKNIKSDNDISSLALDPSSLNPNDFILEEEDRNEDEDLEEEIEEIEEQPSGEPKQQTQRRLRIKDKLKALFDEDLPQPTKADIDQIKLTIRTIYNNTLIIIDEAHNAFGDQQISQSMNLLANHTDRMKILLLSATPMFDRYQDIINMLNLLRRNDKLKPIRAEQIFQNDPASPDDIFKDKDEINSIVGGKELFKQISTGYISYLRGENPYTFPIRIYPSVFDKSSIHHFKGINSYPREDGFEYPTKFFNSNEENATEGIRYVDVYLTTVDATSPQRELYFAKYDAIMASKMTSTKKISTPIKTSIKSKRKRDDMSSVASNEASDKKSKFSIGGVGDDEDDFDEEDQEEEEDNNNNIDENADEKQETEEETLENNSLGGFSYTELNNVSKFLTMSYGWKDKEALEANRLFDVMEIKGGEFEYKKKENLIKYFSKEQLGRYSAKLESICNEVEKSEGIVIIYSNFIEEGLIPMALALENRGFSRKLYSSSSDRGLEESNLMKLSESGRKKFSYTMITGQDKYHGITISPNNTETLKKVIEPSNVDGKTVKVVLLSRAGGEGLDFKNIRQVHILEPWFNLNRVEQVIGRAVRNKGHCAITDLAKWNVQIFMHATKFHSHGDANRKREDDTEAVDLFLYRMGERKSLHIGRVARILKENSVDCLLNQTQFEFTTKDLKEEKTIKLSNGEKIEKYPIGDRDFSLQCDLMECGNYKCSGASDNNTMTTTTTTTTTDKSTYFSGFMKMNQGNIMEMIRRLFKTAYVYKAQDLVAKIQRDRPNYSKIQILDTLNDMAQDPTIIIKDRLNRNGRIVYLGDYFMFHPLELSGQRMIPFLQRMIPMKRSVEYVVRAPTGSSSSSSISAAAAAATITDVAIDTKIDSLQSLEHKFNGELGKFEDDVKIKALQFIPIPADEEKKKQKFKELYLMKFMDEQLKNMSPDLIIGILKSNDDDPKIKPFKEYLKEEILVANKYIYLDKEHLYMIQIDENEIPINLVPVKNKAGLNVFAPNSRQGLVNENLLGDYIGFLDNNALKIIKVENETSKGQVYSNSSFDISTTNKVLDLSPPNLIQKGNKPSEMMVEFYLRYMNHHRLDNKIRFLSPSRLHFFNEKMDDKKSRKK